MPFNLVDRWNRLQTNTQVVISLSLIGLILFCPIDFILLPVNIIGLVLTAIFYGIAWGAIALVNILGFAIVYLILGLGHVLVNGCIFIINGIIDAINTSLGGSLTKIGYIDVMANAPTDIFFLYDPNTLTSKFSWDMYWISMSMDSIFAHIVGWT